MFGLVYTPSSSGRGMATAKTGSFYLTETVILPAATPAGTRVVNSMSTAAYVNVGTGQALAIESVDIIYQAGADLGSDVAVMLAGNGALTSQLTDLNPGTGFVRADSQSLVASGSLNIDQANNVATHVSDIYPDNFGPTALSESFLVVNDNLYVMAGPDGAATFAEVAVTMRIKARIVKLSNSDWVAIAIQSTAQD